jgi:hypothetical protein
MTVFLPPPVPLDMPPGDPAGLADLARTAARASFRMALLDGHLTGPAAAAPGWLGDDAEAAVVQLRRLGELVREGSAALDAAAQRVSLHHERLLSVRSFVTALREHQEADFAVAEYQLARLVDPAAQMSSATEDLQAVAVVEELAAAEGGRRRQHAAAIEEFAQDAAGTAHALAEASAVFGGTGSREDAGRAVAYLAAELPGWGDAELRGRGRALAESFTGLLLSPRERDALAREAVPYAGSDAFAGALLRGMGVDGIRETLSLLGDGVLPAGNALARLLGRALGAAQSTGAHDPVSVVLDATYVDRDDYGVEPDLIALGIGVVLASVGPSVSGGPPPATVVGWGRQILARERELGSGLTQTRAVDRAYPLSDAMVPFDPMAMVARNLARVPDPGYAAALLGDTSTWSQLLARTWDDGVSFGDLVRRAADDPGPAGQTSVRSGLQALGTGLGDHGDPARWTVDQDTAAAVAPALGAALAGHVSVAVAELGVGVDTESAAGSDDALRGLGYLTLDRDAAADIGSALVAWARSQVTALEGTAPEVPVPALAIPSAYLAVREYGQRLAHAIEGFQMQQHAEQRELGWNWTVGLLATFARGPVGAVVGAVEGPVAAAFGFDGTWPQGVDHGLRFDREDAVRIARGIAGPELAAEQEAVDRQARAAFDRTIRYLGRQVPPSSPPHDLAGDMLDVLLDTRHGMGARRPR